MSLAISSVVPLWTASRLMGDGGSSKKPTTVHYLNGDPSMRVHVESDDDDDDTLPLTTGEKLAIWSIPIFVICVIVGAVLLAVTESKSVGFYVGIGFIVAACIIVVGWFRAILIINDDDKNK